MKFGKRVASEAARSSHQKDFLDYKACKRAIQQDVLSNDPKGEAFKAVLERELSNISDFFQSQEAGLEAKMGAAGAMSHSDLHQLRAEITDLRKFAVLNYVAVIKAVKKRNRHLGAKVGGAFVQMRAMDVLSRQYFYTSPKLAKLATQAEIIDQRLESPAAPADELQAEYGCPICLGLLHNPVVLTCAHRFCWGCLLAHCATNLQSHGDSGFHETASGDHDMESDKAAQKEHSAAVAAAEPFEDSATPTVATYDCPVCRKAHVLDLDRLQVDSHLDRFMVDLRKRIKQRGEASSSSEIDQISESIHLALKAGSATQDTASSKAAAPAPDTAAAPDVAVRSVAVSAPLAVPQPSVSRKEAVAMELCKPTGAPERLLTSTLAEEAAPGVKEIKAEVDAVRAAPAEPPLLPPQAPEHKGRLTVVLDMDGTLLSSFTPRRAPVLPPGSIAYVVGRGGRLNPNGVFVVERPGLLQFFQRLSEFAEVVLFTAGLEDYAKPIADELDRRYGDVFHHRLYRPATRTCSAYPCLKDLSRLGRDMNRMVLVDDTPLAFLRQPDNGIPIFNFRGDVDDRVLMEAILPLLQALATSPDVRPVLHRRFDMRRWFISQGVTDSEAPKTPKAAGKAVVKAARPSPASVRPPLSPAAQEALQMRNRACSRTLLLCDFDKTLTDYDAGERLVEELAPELVPMLTALEMPANFVPVTNAVLSEMARRGVSRDKILATLRAMGSELPLGTLRMLQWAQRTGIDVRVLSDCNTLFIGHILTGAKVNMLVKEVITNTSSFERIQSDSAMDLSLHSNSKTDDSFMGADLALSKSGKQDSAVRPSSHRLVIHPHFPYESGVTHGCKLCPANLCKGQELENLRRQHPYQRIVYCGDGANDLCPALSLTPSDVVLARRGHALEKLIAERADRDEDGRVVAQVHIWDDHSQLFGLVQRLVD